MTHQPLLSIRDLKVSFSTHLGKICAVSGVSFDLFQGETVAVVGESGCGKSAMAQAIVRLHPSPPALIEGGSIHFNGLSLLEQPQHVMRQLRGQHIGMIFQDPMNALNPTMRIGKQVIEGLQQHQRLSTREATQRAHELLTLVEIANPERRLKQYPHELSGGMRQRVLIAIALACHPQLLIADEPTTALDVTVQAQILDLLKTIQQKMGTTILLITHDLGIVARMSDRVLVMYGGKIVESGPVHEIFERPLHPYTQGLLASIPRLDQHKDRLLEPIPGSPPNLLNPPAGCAFCKRCKHAMDICRTHTPSLATIEQQHVHCWKYLSTTLA